MKRMCEDWLTSYIKYAGFGEAPKHMHFWTGVSTIAGAVRRQVWMDEVHYKWFPNFYIILVAPPGVVQKSTTASIGMNLLKEVQGVKFGPGVATWQALVTKFSEAAETFTYQGAEWPMSALTISSSELGTLLNPRDTELIDLLVHLWDGQDQVFQKSTKGGGDEEVINPWLNILACTTPAWIAGNFPEYAIGGGFTSRCVFIYADKKERLVPYPSEVVAPGQEELRSSLIHDLQHIGKNLQGAFKMSKAAREWGRAWYERHHQTKRHDLDDARFGGYLARKQGHVHRLAMVLSISGGDSLTIDLENLQVAARMTDDLETDMARVFEKIGNTAEASHATRLLQFISQQGSVPYEAAFRFVHVYFPSARDFDDLLAGLIRAGYVKLTGTTLTAVDLSTPKA